MKYLRAHELLADIERAEVDMVGEKAIIQKRCEGKTRAVFSHNLFQTPPDIAKYMVWLAGDIKGREVLEPSAGLGRIVSPLLKAGASVTAWDISAECCSELYNNYPSARLIRGDFLKRSMSKKFHAVVMNPPFQRGEDIRHIMRAYSLLEPGGVLVSLCYDGVKQNTRLQPWADTWELLPAGSFKKEGTSASVALITKRKGK